MIKKINIEGMTCGHCVKHVEETLKEIAGVNSVKVNLETKSATVEVAEEVADEKIKAAIKDAGYEVTNIQ